MKFLGSPLVETNGSLERNEHGVWTRSYSFEGVAPAIAALASSLPPGVQASYQQDGATATLAVKYPELNNGAEEESQIHEKWEVEREVLEKDILALPVARLLSQEARVNFKKWRANHDEPLPVGSSNYGPNDAVILQNLRALVLAGAESFQTATVVLKRTRTIPAAYTPRIAITEQTQVLSTAALVRLESVPPGLAARLPASPYPAPIDPPSAWGWLPRQASRSYIGKGLAEESNDWLFAAWSTWAYTHVA